MDINQQKSFLESLKDKSDRELLEQQTLYLRMKQLDTARIRNNVVFFFWIAILHIVGIAIWIYNLGLNDPKPY